jgi:hypothetical protein
LLAVADPATAWEAHCADPEEEVASDDRTMQPGYASRSRQTAVQTSPIA